MEIVTGKAGTPHVSSADDGRRIAGEVGTGSYVLQTGGRLAPSLVDANTVRFATGDMIVQGRHIGLTAPEDVKVASGTQGKKRMDYVCVHYKRDVAGSNPTLVETCEWKVLRGTPGTTATAPTVPAGSILDGDAEATVPVASVDFDGLTTGKPKLLIPVLTPLATLGDSVSRARNALILSEDVRVNGYAGAISVRHDGFGTVAERYDEAGFVADEETFVQVSGILWTDNEAGIAWPGLVKAPWQPDDLKDYWCAKIPVEVAKKGAESVAHRAHFDRDCALYISAAANGSITYSGITTKRLFASTDGYIYIALHKNKPDTSPAIIYVDATIPLSSL